MTTRRPLVHLAVIVMKYLASHKSATSKDVADIIQDWFDEDMADLVIKENTDYYVVKFSTINVHCQKEVSRHRGFSFLKKGDAFDYSKTSYHEAANGGSRYQASSDFRNGRICADQTYDPEI